jgi:antitoxin YefM
MSTLSYTELRSNLAHTMDQAIASRDASLVTRQGGKGNVVLMAGAEFRSWQETIHLLSAPANAARLLRSVAVCRVGRCRRRRGTQPDPAPARLSQVKVWVTADAGEDSLHWTTTERDTHQRLNDLIEAPAVTPCKPEPLKGPLTGFWSRRTHARTTAGVPRGGEGGSGPAERVCVVLLWLRVTALSIPLSLCPFTKSFEWWSAHRAAVSLARADPSSRPA